MRDMGKIPNAVEVFGTATLAGYALVTLQLTLFKQVKADQPCVFCIATKSRHHLVDGLIAVLLNVLQNPFGQPF